MSDKKEQNKKVSELITKIRNKTVHGRANWQDTSVDDRYVLKLQSGRILLDKAGEEAYELVILDKEGEPIQSFRRDVMSDDYKSLEEIYMVVYNGYKNVDAAIEDMISEIDESGEIGEKEEELPF